MALLLVLLLLRNQEATRSQPTGQDGDIMKCFKIMFQRFMTRKEHRRHLGRHRSHFKGKVVAEIAMSLKHARTHTVGRTDGVDHTRTRKLPVAYSQTTTSTSTTDQPGHNSYENVNMWICEEPQPHKPERARSLVLNERVRFYGLCKTKLCSKLLELIVSEGWNLLLPFLCGFLSQSMAKE